MPLWRVYLFLASCTESAPFNLSAAVSISRSWEASSAGRRVRFGIHLHGSRIRRTRRNLPANAHTVPTASLPCHFRTGGGTGIVESASIDRHDDLSLLQHVRRYFGNGFKRRHRETEPVTRNCWA